MRTIVMSVCLAAALAAQPRGGWTTLASPVTERLRGISAVSADIAWVSGGHGTILRTRNAGLSWDRGAPRDASTLDFRDIEAFGPDTAYVLSIGSGDLSRIYKTTDGGATWVSQFVNTDPRAFLDALAFFDEQHGLALGDPVDGRFQILRTDDGGVSWQHVAATNVPEARPGESAFAASGTCLVTDRQQTAWFVSGGTATPRVYRSTDRGQHWTAAAVPFELRLASGGLFSVAADGPVVQVVGGDYRAESGGGLYALRSTDGGRAFRASWIRGFRSAVVALPGGAGREWLATGPAGTDRSADGGVTWLKDGELGYHALSVAPDGTVWAAGESGRIGRRRQ